VVLQPTELVPWAATGRLTRPAPVSVDARHKAYPRAARSADPWAGQDDYSGLNHLNASEQ